MHTVGFAVVTQPLEFSRVRTKVESMLYQLAMNKPVLSTFHSIVWTGLKVGAMVSVVQSQNVLCDTSEGAGVAKNQKASKRVSKGT